MAVLTTSGRVAYQEVMANSVFHLAWGTGDVSWGSSPPSESVASVSLLNEVGRREAESVVYVLPDEEGEHALPQGNFAESGTPTRYLMCSFQFDFADADDQTIREVGVFVNTVKEVGVLPGQFYLLPSDVADPGSLVLIDHMTPVIVRSEGVQEQFKYVISI